MIDVLTYDVDEPEIAIRCWNAWTHTVNFLWSYEKFLEWLEMMRSWYADLMDDGIINWDYSIDPWSNITDEDVKKKKELEKGVIEARIEKMKRKMEKETLDMNKYKESVKTKLGLMMGKLD